MIEYEIFDIISNHINTFLYPNFTHVHKLNSCISINRVNDRNDINKYCEILSVQAKKDAERRERKKLSMKETRKKAKIRKQTNERVMRFRKKSSPSKMIISKNIVKIPKKKSDPSMICQEKDQSTPPCSKLIKKQIQKLFKRRNKL